MRKITQRPVRLTRISSKGQVVIPEAARKELRLSEGEVLSVITLPEHDMVVLRKVREPSLKKELPVLKDIAKAWDDIEHGRCKKLPVEDFLKELRHW